MGSHFQYIHSLKDKRVNCFSIMAETSMYDYYHFVERSYKSGGGIENQRPPLTTKSAKLIRERMIEDLKAGAVIPPVVLGVVLNPKEYRELDEAISTGADREKIEDLFNAYVSNGHHVSIIDGMQRTTAIKTVMESGYELFGEQEAQQNKLRIEFWFAESVRSLIYRMLVLNTGQVPWQLSRQIEVLYADVKQEISAALANLTFLPIGEGRQKPGAYPSADILALFIVFGTKKLEPDTQEEVSDQFRRLDFVDSLAENSFTGIFIEILSYMIRLDELLYPVTQDYYEGVLLATKYQNGKNLFDSQPARSGFVFACTEYVMGRIGIKIKHEEVDINREKLKNLMNGLFNRLNEMNLQARADFLDLPTLSEIISNQNSKRADKVGKFERELFARAFRAMINDKGANTFNSYWRD